jgi:hypothetical protein
VRQRRGVRGHAYSWANARRLQRALAEAGIGYSHPKELAPEYRERYLHEILDQVDLDPLIEELPAGRASALLRRARPRRCHRSLVAERLAEEYGVTVVRLLPEERR